MGGYGEILYKDVGWVHREVSIGREQRGGGGQGKGEGL